MHNNTNQSQQKAIQHGTGPAMVLAGPGSGKTFVITNRIKYLIESYHISPEHILVITFTKAASLEMKERFLPLMDEGASLVQFGTFHAIFFHILQFAYQFTYSNIIKESEKYEFMRAILDILREGKSVEKGKEWKQNQEKGWEKEVDMGTGTEDEIKLLLSEISKVKNMGIPIEKYCTSHMEPELFREIYTAYGRCLQENRKLDFDDMVLSCYELLKRDKSVRDFWGEKYRYILIDEFQDINLIQYRTIRLLAEPRNNLFVVGDDDQSIYGFRGASPGILQQFGRDFPEAVKILLDTNYRCSPQIVEASLHVIKENRNRYCKRIIAHKEGEGQKVVLHAFPTEIEQNLNIIHLMKSIHDTGCPYEEIALIYRTNTEMAAMAEKLVEHKIPFQMKEKITSIYEHFIAKDLLAYLSFGENSSRKDFFRMMNKPKRYISRRACGEEQICMKRLMNYYQGKPYILEKIRRLEYDMSQITPMNPYAAINYIRKGMDYDGYLRTLAKEKGICVEEWEAVADELQYRAAMHETYEQWKKQIHEFKEKISVNTQNCKRIKEERKGVQILTMHGVKGLEYENVILSGINEGNVPHKKAVSREEIEEERRLFYVAMTRAKERLFLFYINSNAEQKEPSRFLKVLL